MSLKERPTNVLQLQIIILAFSPIFPQSNLPSVNETICRMMTMSTSNENLEKFLKNYVSMPDSPDYAVLLNGAWGCGKSTFVRTCFQESFDKKEGLYVSLYGFLSLTREFRS